MLGPKLAKLDDESIVEAFKAAGMVLYECAPWKNHTCKKDGCYMHGGECKYTTNISCALMEETDHPGSKK